MMKNLVIFVALLLGSLNFYAQNGNQVIVGFAPCPNCFGSGGVVHPYYGVVPCPFCCGRGGFPITRPATGNVPGSPSFTSHYMPTNKTVNVQVAGGGNKGNYRVYLHDGDEYIKFGTPSKWVKLGYRDFTYNANRYVFRYV